MNKMPTTVSIADKEYSAMMYSDILGNHSSMYTFDLCLTYHDLGTPSHMCIPHFYFPLIRISEFKLPYDQVLQFCLKEGCGLVEGQLLYLFSVVSPILESDISYVIHLEGYESRMTMYLRLLNNDEWEGRYTRDFILRDFILHVILLDDNVHQQIRGQLIKTRKLKLFASTRYIDYIRDC